MFNHHFHRSLIIVALVATTNLIGIATPVLAEDQQPARHHSLIHRQASDLRPLEPATSTPPTATAPSTPAPRPLSRKLAKRPGHTTILGAAAEPPQTTSATALPATTETTKAGTSLAATGTALAGSSVAGVPAAASSASTTATLPLANVAPSTKSAAGAVGSTGTVSSRSLGSPATGGRGLQRLADQLPVSQMIAPTVTISSPSAPSAPRQSSAPSSSEPSTTLPPPPTSTSPGTGSAILSWTSNGEADLAGYKLYVGTAPGQYTYAGSPFVIGLMGSYTISGLPMGQTYYFALSAFDSSGNESGLSSEVSKSIY
ncbi:MAG TPA: hypothetical protein VFQ02_09450 [Nitrospira sp.]|nr:hypothetical protein [Nitrospira sp.]